MADNSIPTDEELRQYVADHMEHFMTVVNESVGQINPSYYENLETRKKGWKRIKLIIPVLVLSAVIFLLGHPLSFLVVAAALLISIWCANSGFKMIAVADNKEVIRVSRAAESALLPLIAQAAGVSAIESVQHTKKDKKDFDTVYRKPGENMFQANGRLSNIARQLHTSYEQDDVVTRLNNSALAAEIQNRISGAMLSPVMYKVHTDTREVILCKLATYLGGGENPNGQRIFFNSMKGGLFVSVDLPRKLEGVTIITTEEKDDLTTQEYYMKALKRMGLNVSELEWNDFEKVLHVVTNNEVEARYILTPDYMTAVHEWWKGRRQDARISFENNKMSLLISSHDFAPGQNLEEISESQVWAYVESIYVPLVNIMYLVNAFDSSR